MNACDMVCWTCFYGTQGADDDLLHGNYLSQDAIDGGTAEEVECILGPFPVKICDVSRYDDFSTMKTIHERPDQYSCGSGRWWDGSEWIGRIDAEDAMDDYEERHNVGKDKDPKEEGEEG